jgi:predicted dehydrogenase
MSDINRRRFLQTSTVAGSALALTAASASRVYGANERVGIAFLGVGGRCQQHIDVILEMKKKGIKVDPIAVCDVWDGDEKLGSGKGRGLYPSAKRCGINVDGDKNCVTKDYRNILDKVKGVDVVCIATPDHWHARMAIDSPSRPASTSTWKSP